MMFLSLISGSNPELLVDQHVGAGAIIRNTKHEVIPQRIHDGANSGKHTSVAYISCKAPFPTINTH